MTKEQIEQLDSFCSLAEGDLDSLKERLHKVVEFKKKQSGGSSEDVLMLRQANDILTAIENLEKIDKKLPESIHEIKDLCHKVHLLLGPQVDLKKAPSGPQQEESKG